MKLGAIILIVWVSTLFGSEKPRITRLKKQKVDSVSHAQSSLKRENELLRGMLKNRKKIDSLLKKKAPKPYIWEKKERIHTGKVYRGILLNSIVSTNLSSPILVRAKQGQGLPSGTKFACKGMSKNKRVHTQCSKMILPDREVRVSAQLLNRDGTAGLVGEVDEKKDEMMAPSLASNFSQGVLEASKSRVNSAYGHYSDSTLENQLKEGLIQSGQTASDIYLEEMRQATPVVTVQAGEEVLIYFKEAADDY